MLISINELASKFEEQLTKAAGKDMKYLANFKFGRHKITNKMSCEINLDLIDEDITANISKTLSNPQEHFVFADAVLAKIYNKKCMAYYKTKELIEIV